MATFKDVFDDFMAGKRVERRSGLSGLSIHKLQNAIAISTDDLTASDWEVVEPKVIITARMFDEAWYEEGLTQLPISMERLKRRLGL